MPALDIWTLDQAAKRLQVSRSTLNRMIRRKELATIRIGGHQRITGAVLKAYAAVRGIDLDAHEEAGLLRELLSEPNDPEPPASEPEPPSWVEVKIPLKNGSTVTTLLDKVDAERFPAERLYLSGTGYVRIRRGRHGLSLARVLLGLMKGDRRMADHINCDPLDNRRSNLRVLTAAESAQNQRPRPGSSGHHRGVSWHALSGKWRARAQLAGVEHHLGLYTDEAEAGLVAATWRARNMRAAIESPDLVPVEPTFHKPADRQSGHRGVNWHARWRRWYVRIRLGGRQVHFGSFRRLEDAIAVRRGFEAARE